MLLKDKVTHPNVTHERCCQTNQMSQKKSRFPVHTAIVKQSFLHNLEEFFQKLQFYWPKSLFARGKKAKLHRKSHVCKNPHVCVDKPFS